MRKKRLEQETFSSFCYAEVPSIISMTSGNRLCQNVIAYSAVNEAIGLCKEYTRPLDLLFKPRAPPEVPQRAAAQKLQGLASRASA